MKRFESPLTRILKLTSQRVRMQQYKLGQIMAQIEELQHQTRRQSLNICEIEHQMSAGSRQKTGTMELQSNRLQLDHLRRLQRQLDATAAELQVLQEQEHAELGRLQAHQEALEKALTGRMDVHRKAQLQEQQDAIDEQGLHSSKLTTTLTLKQPAHTE